MAEDLKFHNAKFMKYGKDEEYFEGRLDEIVEGDNDGKDIVGRRVK